MKRSKKNEKTKCMDENQLCGFRADFVLPGAGTGRTMRGRQFDNVIDIADGLIIAQYYVGLNPENFDELAADVNGDEVIDIIDALLVARYYVGLIPSLPGCQPTPIPGIIYQAADQAGLVVLTTSALKLEIKKRAFQLTVSDLSGKVSTSQAKAMAGTVTSHETAGTTPVIKRSPPRYHAEAEAAITGESHKFYFSMDGGCSLFSQSRGYY